MVNSGVIVTGGASGIGLATIEALLAHDDSFYILLADRDKANGKKQAKRLNGFNGESHPTSLPALRVLFIETDVSSEASIVSLLQTGVSWLASHDAPLRYLINSAGCDFIGTFGDPKLNASALFDRAVAVNLRSVYLLCHHCTPLLAESAGASAPSAGKAAAKPAAKKQKVAAKATPKTAPPPSSSIVNVSSIQATPNPNPNPSPLTISIVTITDCECFFDPGDARVCGLCGVCGDQGRDQRAHDQPRARARPQADPRERRLPRSCQDEH